MNAKIVTHGLTPKQESQGFICASSQRETDLSKPGNVKWLMSHIKWAVKHNQTVIVTPIL